MYYAEIISQQLLKTIITTATETIIATSDKLRLSDNRITTELVH